uniref:Uncharacterized protein n=1 Tax=Branchiostoma floridae TaxID=7739 RepID=C3Y0L1_BRAFL|eukprot:XP_002610274.1 hypothetical protein BRAFLDRAFT_126839 [Branchiostoma floridae]
MVWLLLCRSLDPFFVLERSARTQAENLPKISCGIVGTAFAAYLAGIDISPGNHYRRKKLAEQAEQKAEQHRQEAVSVPVSTWNFFLLNNLTSQLCMHLSSEKTNKMGHLKEQPATMMMKELDTERENCTRTGARDRKTMFGNRLEMHNLEVLLQVGFD